MKVEPLVSCVVPAFNAERYLEEALDSILAQRHRPLEIIVVDDGSTDGTADLAASYGAPVSCERQPNSGAPAARNRGVRAAQGEFVAFLDSDDLWHPEKLELQLARFSARPELDVSMTHIKNFWIPELAGEESSLSEQSGPKPGPLTLTGIVRRALFDRLGLFRESLRHRDSMEWQARAERSGAVIEVLPQVLYSRRIHHANLSRRRAGEDTDDLFSVVRMQLKSRGRPEAL